MGPMVKQVLRNWILAIVPRCAAAASSEFLEDHSVVYTSREISSEVLGISAESVALEFEARLVNQSLLASWNNIAKEQSDLGNWRDLRSSTWRTARLGDTLVEQSVGSGQYPLFVRISTPEFRFVLTPALRQSAVPADAIQIAIKTRSAAAVSEFSRQDLSARLGGLSGLHEVRVGGLATDQTGRPDRWLFLSSADDIDPTITQALWVSGSGLGNPVRLTLRYADTIDREVEAVTAFVRQFIELPLVPIVTVDERVDPPATRLFDPQALWASDGTDAAAMRTVLDLPAVLATRRQAEGPRLGDAVASPTDPFNAASDAVESGGSDGVTEVLWLGVGTISAVMLIVGFAILARRQRVRRPG